ncbi:Thioredoxin domain-containing protein 17 [Entophlyctis luteolus]|nr:Thioredoxin domain-containing protein 17 [Entophlyctis luteolus]
MTLITVEDATTFDSTLAAALPQYSRVFVFATAARDPATGLPWCPDARNADPLVKPKLVQLPDSLLLEAVVGDRPAWRTPSNFYRTHPLLQLTSIPTLLEIGSDGVVVQKLVESEVTEASIAKFIEYSA